MPLFGRKERRYREAFEAAFASGEPEQNADDETPDAEAEPDDDAERDDEH